MKILKTCGSASWGGLEMEVLKFSVALRDRGLEAELLCPKKPRDAGKKLIDLIKSKEHRKKRGNAGRKKVGEKFLFSKFVETLEKIYV